MKPPPIGKHTIVATRPRDAGAFGVGAQIGDGASVLDASYRFVGRNRRERRFAEKVRAK